MKQLVMAAAAFALFSGVAHAGGNKGCVPYCAPCWGEPCTATCVVPAPTCVAVAPTCAPAPVHVCEYKDIERTVMVPTTVTEKQKILTTEYRHDVQDRTYTTYEHVAQHEKKVREYTAYVKEVRSREEKYLVKVPVWKEVECKYTVKVPTTEMRKGTRTVCETVWREVDRVCTVYVPCTETRKHKVTTWRSVPVTLTQKVCEDLGHWEDRPVNTCYIQPGCDACYTGCGVCQTGCNTCAPAPVAACTQKVWVPKIVYKDVPYTVWQYQPYEEEREYQVTCCKPETQTHKVKVAECVTRQVECEYPVCGWRDEERVCKKKVCEWICEEKVRNVNFCVCVPVKKVEEYTVCNVVCVPKQVTVKEHVCVPVTVEKEIDVQVCKWIPQVIKERVAVQICAPCQSACHPACNSCR